MRANSNINMKICVYAKFELNHTIWCGVLNSFFSVFGMKKYGIKADRAKHL